MSFKSLCETSEKEVYNFFLKKVSLMLIKLKNLYSFLYLLKEIQIPKCIYFFILAFSFTSLKLYREIQGHCLLMCNVCLSHTSKGRLF